MYLKCAFTPKVYKPPLFTFLIISTTKPGDDGNNNKITADSIRPPEYGHIRTLTLTDDIHDHELYIYGPSSANHHHQYHHHFSNMTTRIPTYVRSDIWGPSTMTHRFYFRTKHFCDTRRRRLCEIRIWDHPKRKHYIHAPAHILDDVVERRTMHGRKVRLQYYIYLFIYYGFVLELDINDYSG